MMTPDTLPIVRYVRMAQELIRQGMAPAKAVSLVSRSYYLSAEQALRLAGKVGA